jgi:glycosyltransferase involved in cell wall biosynthesis
VKLSVAICTWNRAENLRRTLDELTRVVLPASYDWELLVVNNCCTDHTDDVATSFRGRLPIRVLHETTPGQSHARNLAIREAAGSHIVWTDDDVLVEPNWLCALMAEFERHNADWVFGRSEPEWPGAAPSWYSPRFRGYFAALDYGPDTHVVTDWDHPFFGLNFAGTREAHTALGGFRTEFGFRGTEGGVGEDVDMFERALRASMRIVYTPHACVRHMIPAARVGKQYHRRRQWVAQPVVFQYLDEMFPTVPYLLGLPRFFYSLAANDALGYVKSALPGRGSERFHYELQLVRFTALLLASARHGFKRPARAAKSQPREHAGTVRT